MKNSHEQKLRDSIIRMEQYLSAIGNDFDEQINIRQRQGIINAIFQDTINKKNKFLEENYRSPARWNPELKV